MRHDPITTEVVRHALETIADEMGNALRRTALSVVVKDMKDYSCALFDSRGRLLAAALDIPTLLASMAPALQACMEKWGDDIHPGDAFISNHPYLGACQTNDINLFVPAFDPSGVLIGFTGAIAHHADWGGRVAGTAAAASQSAFEEGVMLPALKLEYAGIPNQTLLDIIAANVRHPKQNLGDLRAQVASARSGVRRLQRLAERYGTQRLQEIIDDLLGYTAERTRQRIQELPDGRYFAEGFLDDDGQGPDRPVRLAATVEITGETLHVDFTGTDPQMRGGMNIPTSTTRSVVHYAVKSLMPDDMPFNEGSLDPVTIHAPEGSAVNPIYPAAVGDRHLASQRLASVITKALLPVDPSRSSAEWFVGWPVLICESRSPKTGDGVVLLANVAGGAGATASHDGADAVDVHMANCAIIPAEIIESNYMLRVERYELRCDSGGAGEYRGGLGIRADYRNLSDMPMPYLSETEQSNPKFAPSGHEGGLSGGVASLALLTEEGEVPLPTKGEGKVDPGEVISLRAGGGGGFGNPRTRKAELVAADVSSGRVSREVAADVYGYSR